MLLRYDPERYDERILIVFHCRKVIGEYRSDEKTEKLIHELSIFVFVILGSFVTGECKYHYKIPCLPYDNVR